MSTIKGEDQKHQKHLISAALQGYCTQSKARVAPPPRGSCFYQPNISAHYRRIKNPTFISFFGPKPREPRVLRLKCPLAFPVAAFDFDLPELRPESASIC